MRLHRLTRRSFISAVSASGLGLALGRNASIASSTSSQELRAQAFRAVSEVLPGPPPHAARAAARAAFESSYRALAREHAAVIDAGVRRLTTGPHGRAVAALRLDERVRHVRACQLSEDDGVSVPVGMALCAIARSYLPAGTRVEMAPLPLRN